jgi:hypothetical protein
MVMGKRKGFINKGKRVEKDGKIVTHHLPPTEYVACSHATLYPYIYPSKLDEPRCKNHTK